MAKGSNATRITIHKGSRHHAVVVESTPGLILPIVGDDATLDGEPGWLVTKLGPTTIMLRVKIGQKRKRDAATK